MPALPRGPGYVPVSPFCSLWNRKNSAQKTIHNMLDHDPRYLRPDTREDMNQRIQWLSASPTRRRRRQKTKSPPRSQDVMMDVKTEPDSDAGLHDMGNAGHSATPLGSWKAYYSPSQGYGDVPHAFGPGHAQITSGRGQSDVRHLPPKGPVRHGSTMHSQYSQSSDVSSQTIEDLKNRLSGCSTHYANQISNLLSKFTIGSGSHLSKTSSSLTRRGSTASTDGGYVGHHASLDGSFALPGDLFNVQKFKESCFRGSTHDAGRCWCAVAASIANLNDLWVTKDDELSPQAQRILLDPSALHLGLRDRFGNTPLHLFAAREGFQIQLMRMVATSERLAATNTGGQTFLHVLAPSWFLRLEDQYAPLHQLLAHVRGRQPEVVYMRDVYGRTLFHRMHALLSDAELVAGVARPYDAFALSRRDAFGHQPLAPPPALASPHTSGNLSPLEDEGGGSPFPNEDAFIRHHELLLRIVTASDSNPTVEDPEGRNGLHCLAEAIIDKKIMDEHRNALSTGRPVKRGKLAVARGAARTGGTAAAGPSTSSSSSITAAAAAAAAASAAAAATSDTSDDGTPATPHLATRLRLVQGLLAPPSVVDVNHYDARGDTALMAFVTHLPDDQEDKAKNLATILEALIAAGARVEGRNRRGETALLAAARLGRKIALAVLLEHGANVRARDAGGRGVLDLLDGQCRAATADVTLYGRLEACRVLLTGKRQEQLGVQLRPTVVDEWSVRPGRSGEAQG